MGSRRLALVCAFFLAACGPSVQPGDNGDGGSHGEIDADPLHPPDPDATPWSEPDGGIAYPDAEPYADGGTCNDWVCTTPVVDGCGGTDICGNGTDEDCDGHPDDGCSCTPGAVQDCFMGPPGRRGVGSCVDGHQTCTGSGEFTQWGPCTGGIRPGEEQCDGQDNDCNGCDDDNPECCVVNLACPGPGDMPDGTPYTNYVINGANFYGGIVTSWAWDVHGGPCDVLFETTTTPVVQSFTLTGATSPTLTFHPTLSGDYTIHVHIVAADGSVYDCTFIVHIGGPGLRVELCSDKSANTDLDLHVHKAGTTTPWFTTALTGSAYNADDCYYLNCTATDSGSYLANWYANSPLANCSGGPEGTSWTALGYCRNPRLDIDSIDQRGRPENTNVDNPLNAGLYRVMVHYYSGSVTVHPLVNIYCGGYLKGSYGLGPDYATLTTSGGFGAGQMWRVVDAAPVVAAGVTTDCALTALHPPAMTTGYWITNNDRSY